MEAETEKEGSAEKRREGQIGRQSEAKKRMDGCGWGDIGRDKE